MHDTTANPNLPTETIGLDAFNLRPGVAFMLIDQPDPTVWVVVHADRSGTLADDERVMVWARDAVDAEGDVRHLALNLDYCTKVAMVGIVVNEADDCDNNWGAN